MNWSAVIVAAGRGTRFGRPKQLIEIGGRPMLAWSLQTFAAMPEVAAIVVVTERDWIAEVRALAARLAPDRNVRVVVGGATRQASVRCGLDVLPPECDAVLIHDGARPLVRADDVRAGMQEVRPGRAAVLAAPVVDTIKVVDPQTMLVQRTLDRSELWAAQTPQFAMRDELVRAHETGAAKGLQATDDVGLLEAIGVDVAVVRSSGENFKVTHPGDVARAQGFLP
jgi:2-C-methyl-D-erythritol 4-phosphate cytidylyltransferase